jgi:hypothetical protein
VIPTPNPKLTPGQGTNNPLTPSKHLVPIRDTEDRLSRPVELIRRIMGDRTSIEGIRIILVRNKSIGLLSLNPVDRVDKRGEVMECKLIRSGRYIPSFP